MFKKLLFVLILIFCIGFQTALALEIGNPLGEGVTDIFILLDRIMLFIFLFSIPVAIIMLMYAGFMYMTSSGNPKNIPNVSKMIQYTLIGFIIVLLAKGIIFVVKDVLINGATSNPTTSNQGTSPINAAVWKWVCNYDGSCTQSPDGIFDTEQACKNYPCKANVSITPGSGGTSLYICDRKGSSPKCVVTANFAGLTLLDCQNVCR